MFNQLLNFLSRKPELYEPCTSSFWDDAHISASMLEAHINPELDAASRKLDFVQRSADWILQIADTQKRPSFLDLGCGPGIYADLFAKQGFNVQGIDLSPRSIAYAKEHTNHSIRYICQDYLSIAYKDVFDVVTLIYCDFGVLRPSDRKILLKKIHGALKENGLFIFDVCSVKQYESWNEKTDWSYSGGGFWSAEPYACLYAFYRYDECRTYNQQYVIIQKNDVRCFNIWNHAFTPDELMCDMAEAGFQDTRLFDNVAGDAYTGQSPAICVVTRK